MTQPQENRRYDALDGVRATAMLLGVVFHAIQLGGMAGGPPGFGGPVSGAMIFNDWLHSFRMPLFFVIAGFFSRLMREKYPLGTYLRRRWIRLGVPMLLGIFTVVPLYQWNFPGRGGPPGFGLGGPPGFSRGEMPPPPPGFVPPPLQRFDVDDDGSLSASEWKAAQGELARMGPPGGPPPGGGRGAPGRPPGGPGPFGPRNEPLNQWLFGEYGRSFTLSHLWFLWYLLIFLTITPVLAAGFDRAFGSAPAKLLDRLGRPALAFNLAPLALGLVSLPALMITPGFMGWSLGFATGIFRGFPDFLYQYQPDFPYYFTFFLAGWWLHREREALDAAARWWLPSTVVGLVAYLSARHLSQTFAMQTARPEYPLLRLAGYGLYAISTAYMSSGFIGLFQRYMDHPSRAGRYLADTAFWVYVVHQVLIQPLVPWIAPLGLPWWFRGTLLAGLATLGALILYEFLVKPTFLARIFGPPSARRRRREPEFVLELLESRETTPQPLELK